MKPLLALTSAATAIVLSGCSIHVHQHGGTPGARIARHAPAPAAHSSPRAESTEPPPAAPSARPSDVAPGARRPAVTQRTDAPAPAPAATPPAARPGLTARAPRPAAPQATRSAPTAPEASSPTRAAPAAPSQEPTRGGDAPGRGTRVVAAPVAPAASTPDPPRDPTLPVLTPTADTRLPEAEGAKTQHRGRIAHRKQR